MQLQWKEKIPVAPWLCRWKLLWFGACLCATFDPQKSGREVWILQHHAQSIVAIDTSFLALLLSCSVRAKVSAREEEEIDGEVVHGEYKRNKCQVPAGGRWIKIVSGKFPEWEVIFMLWGTGVFCSSGNFYFFLVLLVGWIPRCI